MSEFRNLYETDIQPLINQLTENENKLMKEKAKVKTAWENSGLKAAWACLSEEDQNKQKKIFQEFHQKVENFLSQNQELEPLAGVDLAGVGKEELRKLPHGGPVPQIVSSTIPEINQYKD